MQVESVVVRVVREQEQPLGGKEENESTEHGGSDHHDCPQAVPERSRARCLDRCSEGASISVHHAASVAPATHGLWGC
jgi:hypothetical protein